MRNLSEDEIITQVVLRMRLPENRPQISSDQYAKNMELALKVIAPFVPPETAQIIMREKLIDFAPTPHECLQVWALYMDFHAMKRKQIVRYSCKNAV